MCLPLLSLGPFIAVLDDVARICLITIGAYALCCVVSLCCPLKVCHFTVVLLFICHACWPQIEL